MPSSLEEQPCTCFPNPVQPEGPAVDCDVHGQPSAAHSTGYRTGYGDGYRAALDAVEHEFLKLVGDRGWSDQCSNGFGATFLQALTDLKCQPHPLTPISPMWLG